MGVLFFVLVFFAALTSSISLMEAGVAIFSDQTGWKRGKCISVMILLILMLGSLSAFGFNLLDSVLIFGMGFLDFFDFLSNSVMMPIAALATCVLVFKVVGRERFAEEVEFSSKFNRKKMFNVVIKYVAPVFLVIILLSSIANVLGIIKM